MISGTGYFTRFFCGNKKIIYWRIIGIMASSAGARRRGGGQVKIEYEKEDKKPVTEVAEGQVDAPPKTKKAKPGNKGVKQEETKMKNENGAGASSQKPAVGAADVVDKPPHWEEVVENIKKMRVNNPAPVDTMGCERTMDENAEPKVRRYQSLISLLLSSQTKDEVTFAAMGRLKEYGCTPEKMLEIAEDKLAALLKPVGFYNTKGKNIKKVSQILLDKYDGDIPNNVEELMKLPGIGPKMSYICMNVAWGVNAGIGVDTHVHRISERLGWTKLPKGKKAMTPEDTREQLEAWLPNEHWQEVNILLVGFGQTICTPINPKCGQCLNNQICPLGKKNVKSTKKNQKD